MGIALYNPKLNQFYNSDNNNYTSSVLIRRGNVYYPNTKIYDSKEEAKAEKQNIGNNELVIVEVQIKIVKDE